MSVQFKNSKELEAFLKSNAQVVLDKMADDVKEIVDKHIRAYYGNYDPKQYIRTNQFLQSCVRTNIEWSGNTASAVVYIDFEKLKYKSATGLQVVDWANEGLHGGFNVGDSSNFWDDSIDEVNAKKLLLEIAKGIKQSLGLEVKFT